MKHFKSTNQNVFFFWIQRKLESFSLIFPIKFYTFSKPVLLFCVFYILFLFIGFSNQTLFANTQNCRHKQSQSSAKKHTTPICIDIIYWKHGIIYYIELFSHNSFYDLFDISETEKLFFFTFFKDFHSYAQCFTLLLLFVGCCFLFVNKYKYILYTSFVVGYMLY